MREKGYIRTHWLTIRLNSREQARLQTLFHRSKCGGLSEYARSVLLQEPVIIAYRNESADEILAVFLELKKELGALGNNFNQAVKKLHAMDHMAEVKAWAIIQEAHYQQLLKKVEEIREKMILIHAQWSRK